MHEISSNVKLPYWEYEFSKPNGLTCHHVLLKMVQFHGKTQLQGSYLSVQN